MRIASLGALARSKDELHFILRLSADHFGRNDRSGVYERAAHGIGCMQDVAPRRLG